MADYYGRMEIMRMSDEEIKELLSHGETLDEGVCAMMLDELKRREQEGEVDTDLGLTEEELAALNAEAGDEDGETEESGEELEEEPEELTEEEKFEKLEEEIDRQNKENKRTLIIACVGAAVVAVGAIVILLILRALGKL